MKNMVSRLLRQSAVYAFGNVALKASGLVLAVVYLDPDYLSVAEFGYFSLVFVTAQLGIFVVGLGLSTGMLKFMADPAYTDARDALPFTTLAATTAAAAVALGMLWMLARPLAGLLVGTPARSGVLHLMTLYVAAKAVGGVPMMVLRAEERAGWYITALIAEAMVLIGATYAFMVVFEWGLAGLMGAYAASAALSTAVLVAGLLVREAWRFERRLVVKLIRYGGPLVLASFAGWFLNAGDRYLLKWLTDAATVGLYEWGARLAGLLNMLVVQSFNLAFSVVGLKALGNEGAGDGRVHRDTLRHFVIWTGWAVLGLSLLAYDLTRLLPAATAYLEADALVLALALGFMNYGIYYVLINVGYATGRTKDVGLNVLAAAVLNAVLNVALIPLFGALGAAVATALAYLALALGASYVARKDVAVSFPWALYLVVLAFVGGLYALGQPVKAWPTGARLAVRAGLILAYPVLVLVMGVYRRSELRSARAWFREQIGISPNEGRATEDGE